MDREIARGDRVVGTAATQIET
nr:hypothetical protein [Streptomyces sp. DSM 41633]